MKIETKLDPRSVCDCDGAAALASIGHSICFDGKFSLHLNAAGFNFTP